MIQIKVRLSQARKILQLTYSKYAVRVQEVMDGLLDSMLLSLCYLRPHAGLSGSLFGGHVRVRFDSIQYW